MSQTEMHKASSGRQRQRLDAITELTIEDFKAERIKTGLNKKIIKEHGGIIAAFDGDQVMGVFQGDSKNTSAAKSALSRTRMHRQANSLASVKTHALGSRALCRG